MMARRPMRANRFIQADQDAAYQMEHALAYGLMGLAILFGFIGLIRGFGVVGGNDASNTPFGNVSALWDGVVWLLPAITAGILATAFHNNEHHRLTNSAWADDTDEGMWNMEHLASYVAAALAALFALLGLLVGFHLLGRGDTQIDSMPWHLASIVMATLTGALHSVRHHQTTQDDFVVVERHEIMQERSIDTPRTEVRRSVNDSMNEPLTNGRRR